jgi:hypothetical protein
LCMVMSVRMGKLSSQSGMGSRYSSPIVYCDSTSKQAGDRQVHVMDWT